MASNRSGLPTVTRLIEHICQIVVKYGAAANAAIDAAVASSAITAGDAVIAKAFLASATGACAIFKRITGY